MVGGLYRLSVSRCGFTAFVDHALAGAICRVGGDASGPAELGAMDLRLAPLAPWLSPYTTAPGPRLSASSELGGGWADCSSKRRLPCLAIADVATDARATAGPDCVLEDPSLRLQHPLTKGPML